jgi:hypothetical protein
MRKELLSHVFPPLKKRLVDKIVFEEPDSADNGEQAAFLGELGNRLHFPRLTIDAVDNACGANDKMLADVSPIRLFAMQDAKIVRTEAHTWELGFSLHVNELDCRFCTSCVGKVGDDVIEGVHSAQFHAVIRGSGFFRSRSVVLGRSLNRGLNAAKLFFNFSLRSGALGSRAELAV